MGDSVTIDEKQERILLKSQVYHAMNLVDFINGASIQNREDIGTCTETFFKDVDRARAAVERLKRRLYNASGCCVQKCSRCGGYSLALAEGAKECQCLNEAEDSRTPDTKAQQ
jgi:hypothetical protein